MALDASRVLGSPQLAAAKVWPRGQAWLTAARVNYSADAVLLAPLVARMMFGPRPDRSPAQTPRFGFAALIAVTKDELALVSLKARAPAGVIARVPLSEVKAFDLVGARGVWPLTITFGDGDIWRLEVPRRNKKAARAVAAVVSGQGQPSSPAPVPATGRRGTGPGTGGGSSWRSPAPWWPPASRSASCPPAATAWQRRRRAGRRPGPAMSWQRRRRPGSARLSMSRTAAATRTG